MTLQTSFCRYSDIRVTSSEFEAASTRIPSPSEYASTRSPSPSEYASPSESLGIQASQNSPTHTQFKLPPLLAPVSAFFLPKRGRLVFVDASLLCSLFTHRACHDSTCVRAFKVTEVCYYYGQGGEK